MWLAEFLCGLLADWSVVHERLGNPGRASELRRRREGLVEAVNRFGWDGSWYLRGTLDDGTPLGSADNEEGRIFLNPQIWAVLNDVAPQERARQCMDAVREHLLDEAGALLLAPAYTFIIRNRPVDYQFWLNVGGRGWWERLYQPLTHPYVLSRHWPPSGREDATWADTDEVEAREEALHRLVQGLLRRCRRRVYLGLSELGEQGYEQKGALLRAIQRVLRSLTAEPRD